MDKTEEKVARVDEVALVEQVGMVDTEAMAGVRWYCRLRDAYLYLGALRYLEVAMFHREPRRMAERGL